MSFYLQEEKSISDKSGEIKIDNYHEQFETLLEIANSEPQELINEYKILQFSASRSWVYQFMMRHRLVFRKPHYERRG